MHCHRNSFRSNALEPSRVAETTAAALGAADVGFLTWAMGADTAARAPATANMVVRILNCGDSAFN